MFVCELEVAGEGGKRGVDIGNWSDVRLFIGASSALLGAADETFESSDGKALADAGAAVDALVLASLKPDLLDNAAKISGNFDLTSEIASHPGFLRSDGHAFLKSGWIVGANFGADAVF